MPSQLDESRQLSALKWTQGRFKAETKLVTCLRRVSCLGGGLQPRHRSSGVRQVSPGGYYDAGRRTPLPPSQASMASSERVSSHASTQEEIWCCVHACWQLLPMSSGRQAAAHAIGFSGRSARMQAAGAPLPTSQALPPIESQLSHSFPSRALMLPDGISIAA